MGDGQVASAGRTQQRKRRGTWCGLRSQVWASAEAKPESAVARLMLAGGCRGSRAQGSWSCLATGHSVCVQRLGLLGSHCVDWPNGINRTHLLRLGFENEAQA